MAAKRMLYTGPKILRWKFPILPVLEAIAPGAPMPARRSGRTKARCPFHDDATASASVDFNNQRFTCYSAECGVCGDAVDVVQAVEGMTRAEARQRCEAIVGTGRDQVRSEPDDNGQGLFDW